MINPNNSKEEKIYSDEQKPQMICVNCQSQYKVLNTFIGNLCFDCRMKSINEFEGKK